MAKVSDENKDNSNKKNKKNQNIRLVAWTVVTLLVFAVLHLDDFLFSNPCDAPLKYQNEQLNVELAIDKLALDLSVNSQSVRAMSDTLQSLMTQSGELCRLFEVGRIDSVVYYQRQVTISNQFQRLMRLQKQQPAASVSARQMKFYLGELSKIRQ